MEQNNGKANLDKTSRTKKPKVQFKSNHSPKEGFSDG
jgi:hypothetical protein